MKLPAQVSIEMQDCYPLQADGGFKGDLSSSLQKALAAWEKRREYKNPLKFNGKWGAKEKKVIASRGDISWNANPEVKKPMSEKEKQKRKEYKAEVRRRETLEQRKKRLDARRAAYREKHGPPKRRPRMTREERTKRQLESKLRYLERKKAGVILERPKSKFTAEQLKAKAVRQKKYYQRNKIA
jgi:hypothetical protein